MVVIGSFGFVENSGASFEQVGLEECKDRRATENLIARHVSVAFRTTRKQDTDCLDRERSTASTPLSLPHFQLIWFQNQRIKTKSDSVSAKLRYRRI